MKIEIVMEMPASVFFWWESKFRTRNWIFTILERIWLVLPLRLITNAIKYEETLEEGEEEYQGIVIESVKWPPEN